MIRKIARVRHVTYGAIVALVTMVLLGGAVMAAIVTDTRARGTLSDAERVNVPGVAKFENGGPVDFVHAELTFQPGDATPWHYHPGPTLVTVKQGQITFTTSSSPEDCSSRTYTAGQSFVEGHPGSVGRAQNTSTGVTIVVVTFVAPVGSAVTFPVPPRTCSGD